MTRQISLTYRWKHKTKTKATAWTLSRYRFPIGWSIDRFSKVKWNPCRRKVRKIRKRCLPPWSETLWTLYIPRRYLHGWSPIPPFNKLQVSSGTPKPWKNSVSAIKTRCSQAQGALQHSASQVGPKTPPGSMASKINSPREEGIWGATHKSSVKKSEGYRNKRWAAWSISGVLTQQVS